ncbi:MAG: polysaccharide deacetylase family protein [Candidatus Omnitrophica bacterium]|nr:polysaccharide deacetylase family protein [Candidatus Omnitrophota bacterium]
MFKQKSRIILAAVLLTGIIFVFNFLRQGYIVPVLMYHRVEPVSDGSMLMVSSSALERQMKFLRDHNYNVIRLKELVGLIKENKKIPAKTVAITFDDGNKDNYTCAFPVLKKYRIPATMFVIVDEISRPQGDRLSWEEIKTMLDSGLVDIGSHTMGPQPLIFIESEDELKRQIFASKKILENRLGYKIDLFSYPEGFFNAKIRQLVIDAGYLGAVATNPGRKYPSKDVFLLKRIRISENSSNMFVFAVESSGFYTIAKEYKKAQKEAKNERR